MANVKTKDEMTDAQKAEQDRLDDSRWKAREEISAFINERWETHWPYITIIGTPTYEELLEIGRLPRSPGILECGKLIKAPVIHDEIVTALCEMLATKVRSKDKDSPVDLDDPGVEVAWRKEIQRLRIVEKHNATRNTSSTSLFRKWKGLGSSALSPSVDPKQSKGPEWPADFWQPPQKQAIQASAVDDSTGMPREPPGPESNRRPFLQKLGSSWYAQRLKATSNAMARAYVPDPHLDGMNSADNSNGPSREPSRPPVSESSRKPLLQKLGESVKGASNTMARPYLRDPRLDL